MSYTFYLYDRWGKQIGTLGEVYEAIHTDEVNGEDSLSLSVAPMDLEKGQRIVWRDKFGALHEHTISELSVTHSDGKVATSIHAENSIAELLTDYIVEREPQGEITVALQRALEDTRWQIGDVDVAGEKHTSWYHISVYEAISDIVSVWGGELSATIEMDGSDVSARRVNIQVRRGGDHGRIFSYGHSLVSIDRKVDTGDIYTALYGYGKGLEKYDEDGNSTGGYSRKLTFGSINGGKDWVGDEDAKLRWGLPDGHGGVKHTFGKVEFDDCEDQSELLALTKEALKSASVPRVVYTGTVANLADGGYVNGEDTMPGDTVYLRDKVLDLRVQGRALRIERDLIDERNTVITLGNLSRTFSSELNGSAADLDWLKSHVTNWDMTVNLGSAYLNAVINQWNEVINATGGYVYWEQGEGITVYDKPLENNPTMAIQLRGGSFRIANSRLPNGDWDWRTIGTGDGFVADMLIAGTIKGGSNYWNLETGELMFKQGGIYDTSGNNYWNLSQGTFALQNGSENGIWMSGGKLSINADCLVAGRIQDKWNYNYWDLDNGEFHLSPLQTHVGSQTLQGYIEDNAKDTFADATPTEVFNKLTNDGRILGLWMNGNGIYINASYINTGTFSVGTLFTANKTAGTVELAGFTAHSGELRGEYIRLNINYIDIYSSINGSQIGRYGPAWLYDDSNRRFVAMFSNQAGIALATGSNQAVSASNCKALYATSYGAWFSSGWNFWGSVDFHGATLNNCNIPSASSIAVADAIEDTITFPVITKINDDGTIAEYVDACELGFTNGILTSMTKPEGGA